MKIKWIDELNMGQKNSTIIERAVFMKGKEDIMDSSYESMIEVS